MPDLSVHVVDADSGDVLVSEGADRALRTASVAKVLVLTALAEALESGAVGRDELLDRTTTPRVADSGLWQHLSADALPVVDVAVLVGSVSDNWATNVLLERLGLDAVQAVADREGLAGTRLWDVVRDRRGPHDPPTLSTGTAADWCTAFARLHAGEWVSPGVSASVLGWLAPGVDHSLVAAPFALDPLVAADHGFRVVNKTGADDDVRCDTGLVLGGRRVVAYAVLANGPGDLVTPLRSVGEQLRDLVG